MVFSTAAASPPQPHDRSNTKQQLCLLQNITSAHSSLAFKRLEFVVQSYCFFLQHFFQSREWYKIKLKNIIPYNSLLYWKQTTESIFWYFPCLFPAIPIFLGFTFSARRLRATSSLAHFSRYLTLSTSTLSCNTRILTCPRSNYILSLNKSALLYLLLFR